MNKEKSTEMWKIHCGQNRQAFADGKDVYIRERPVPRIICRLWAYVPRNTEEPFTEMNEENIRLVVGKIKSTVLNMLSERDK